MAKSFSISVSSSSEASVWEIDVKAETFGEDVDKGPRDDCSLGLASFFLLDPDTGLNEILGWLDEMAPNTFRAEED